MNVKFHKRITRAMAKQLTTLAWSADEQAADNEVFVSFYDKGEKFVGATKLEFFINHIENGTPLYEIYIWKFEIVSNRRGENFGKYMFEWIVENYHPYMIELQHIDSGFDDGSSYRWWRSLGFRHEKHSKTMMEKIITK